MGCVHAQRDKALEVASHVASSTTAAPGTVASVCNELVSQLCRHPSEHMASDDTDEIVAVITQFLQALAPVDVATAVGQIDAVVDYVGAQPAHRPLALKLLRAASDTRLRLHVVRDLVGRARAASCSLTVLVVERQGHFNTLLRHCRDGLDIELAQVSRPATRLWPAAIHRSSRICRSFLVTWSHWASSRPIPPSS